MNRNITIQNETMSKELKSLQNKSELLGKTNSAALSTATQQLETKRDELTAAMRELTESKQQCKSATESLDRTISQLANLNIEKSEMELAFKNEIESKEQKITQMMKDSSATSASLRSKLDAENENRRLELESTRKDAAQKLHDLQSAYDALKEQMNSQISAKNDELKTNAEAATNDLAKLEESLKASLEWQRKEMKENHEAALEKLKSEASQDATKLEDNLKAVKLDLQAMTAQVKTLEKEKDQVMRKAVELEAKNAKLDKQNKQQVNATQQKLDTASSELQQLKQKSKQQLESIEKKYKDELAKIQSEKSIAATSLQAKAKQELTNELAKQQEEFNMSTAAIRDELQTTINGLTLELKTICEQAVHDKQTHTNAMDELIGEHAAKVDAMKESFVKERAEVEQEWQSNIAQLKATFENKLAESENDRTKLESDLSERHDRQMTEIKSLFEEEKNLAISELQRSHDRIVSFNETCAETRRVNELSQAQQQKMKELEELKQSLQNELEQNLKAQMTMMDGKLNVEILHKSQLEKHLCDKSEELKSTRQTIANLEDEVHRGKQELSDTTEKLSSEMEEMVAYLNNKRKTENESMLEQHILETRSMSEKFESVRADMEHEIESIKSELHLAEERYESRESREEVIFSNVNCNI